MDWLNILIRNKAFWATLLALVNLVVFVLWPNFPKEVWAAFDALAMVIFGALATQNQVQEVRALARTRAARGKGNG